MRARDFGRGAAPARRLDAADELRAFRARFALPKDGRRTLTYLCGHSLGLMPREVPRRIAAELERWAELGVEGHFADAPRSGALARSQVRRPVGSTITSASALRSRSSSARSRTKSSR